MSTAGLAQQIAERARACPGVVDLTAGARGEVVTYRPGPPLAGVAVRDEEIQVALVVRPDRPVTETAAAVRAALAPLAAGRPLHIIVADVAVTDR